MFRGAAEDVHEGLERGALEWEPTPLEAPCPEGKKIFFPRPSWQTARGVPAGTQRLVPDVSPAADPNQGAFLVFHGGVVQIGGISWSAPVWAGFCALINEARAKAHKPFLPFMNPLIYPLAGSSSFRDVTHGSNGAFAAGPGFDMVTGIGVPNVKEAHQSAHELSSNIAEPG